MRSTHSFLPNSLFSLDDVVSQEWPHLIVPNSRRGRSNFLIKAKPTRHTTNALAILRTGLVIHSSSYTEARACVIIIWSHFPSWPRNMVFLLSFTINSATGNRHTSRKSLQPSGRSTYSSTNSLIFSITSTSKMGSTSQVILGVYSLPNSKFAGSLRDWSTWSLLVPLWDQMGGERQPQRL